MTFSSNVGVHSLTNALYILHEISKESELGDDIFGSTHNIPNINLCMYVCQYFQTPSQKPLGQSVKFHMEPLWDWGTKIKIKNEFL